MPPTVRDIASLMQSIAPLSYAEPWDKVGLLVGDAARTLTGPVLLTIDLTEAVMAEAVAMKASVIIAYHPPIFEPLARITDATPRQRIILRAAEHHIAIYSPHTALDAIPGGVCDWLCEGISGSTTPGKINGDIRALTPHPQQPVSQQCKVVTFVQAREVEQVRAALATAGAGIIGNYQVCSFSSEGEGTFLGSDATNPAVGSAGQLEHVRECRLEMVCSKASVALAIETLRRFHPYEEPAIDVYDLKPQPIRNAGAGRRLVLDKPATVLELAQRLKTHIKRDRTRYSLAWPTEPNRLITRVGVVPGSGSELSRTAREEGCEVFVTGEMKHHEIMGAIHAGMSIVLGGHTNTERGYLPRLADRLREKMPTTTFAVSTADKDPLEAA